MIIVNDTTYTHTITSTLAGAATSLAKMGLGSIILSGDKNLASLFTTNSGGFDTVTNLTLNLGNAVTATYTGAIADGATGMALTKTGAGTQALAGANTYTGATTVDAGTLRLDYGTQNASKLSDTAALMLGNGTLELAGGTHTQVVASTTLTGNAIVTRSAGAAKIALGAISGAGSVDFSADNIATTTTPNNSLGLLPFATIAGSNPAANDGSGNIVTFTGYTPINARGPSTVPHNANAIVRIVGDGTSGNIALAAVSTAAAGTVVLAGSNTYTGTTTVGEGTLVLSGSLTGSAVPVVGDAVLDQTSSGSGVDGNPSLAVTGGQLVLTVAGVGYTSWAASFPPSPTPTPLSTSKGTVSRPASNMWWEAIRP